MMHFPSVGFRGFRGARSLRRVTRLLPLYLVVAFVFAVALSVLSVSSSRHLLLAGPGALGSGPAARTKAIALNATAATLLRYSSTFTHMSGVCRVETASINVFIVDAGSTSTAQGEGPYTSTSGPFAIGGLDSAIAASGTPTVRCRFYDAPIAGLSAGGGGIAADLVCLLAGPCTMTSTMTFSGVTTDITTAAGQDLRLAAGASVDLNPGDNVLRFRAADGVADSTLMMESTGADVLWAGASTSSGAVGLNGGALGAAVLGSQNNAASTTEVVRMGDGISLAGTTALWSLYGEGMVRETGTAFALATPTDTTTAPASGGTACRLSTTGVSAWTPAETNAVDGFRVCCTNLGADNVTVTDVDGVYEGPGSVLGTYDVVCMAYVVDRWVQRSVSDNEP